MRIVDVVVLDRSFELIGSCVGRDQKSLVCLQVIWVQKEKNIFSVIHVGNVDSGCLKDLSWIHGEVLDLFHRVVMTSHFCLLNLNCC